MIYFKLNPYLHKTDVDTSVLYHGSPIKINDNNMASGTFFSIDKNIARDYGKFIYSIELNEKIATKLKEMPDEIWNGLNLATRVQAEYSCSPFTPKDWIDKAVKKFGTKKEDIERYKNSQLSVVLPNGN